MQLAYYPGCSLKQSSALYDVQCQLVFNKLNIRLVELEDWNCCGATSAGKTDDFLAIAMPARNVGIAAQSGLDTLLIPCSACYSRTLVAQHYLAAHPEQKEEINEGLGKKIDGPLKVSSILEVLQTTLESGVLTDALVSKPVRLKPVCYYGCMLTRFPFDVPVSDDIENPIGMDTLIEAMGIHAIDWNYKTNCCGASAAVNDPDTAFHLMSKIMTDAIARGANCIITTCPMCQLNLDAYQEAFCKQYNIEERLPVFFITEVLGMAMGLDFHDLQIDRHFIDGTDLFKEMEPYE
ncbi:MAG: CoB--CoM heterodisulfide reductase iron-sulfur subunit B family protein [Thermodesulfobacteriota bacterium]|nr:CoB--CoM heterodisulfide reductase iron-sulfur subunit B family protein [Thermodesulfobacteriota bacterium]